MEGSSSIKYSPNKTQLTLTELRELCEALKAENRKLKAELRKAQIDRAWALEKLQDEQIENRRLGITITHLMEGGRKER